MQSDIVVVIKPWVGIAISTLGAFTLGGVWVNFRYMRKNMVTKKDLTIAFYKFSVDYVTKADCGVMMRSKPNGRKVTDYGHDRS